MTCVTLFLVRTARYLRPFIHSFGLKVYRFLPPAKRDAIVFVVYRLFGPMFRGMPHYESWRYYRNARSYSSGGCHEVGSSAWLVDPNWFSPLSELQGKNIAVHVHLYYVDLLDEIQAYLQNIPFSFDLFVSVASDDARDVCRKDLQSLTQARSIRVSVVPNRGRDVGPMICEFGQSLAAYDYVCHIHGKKSLYNAGASAGWREYLFNALLGDEKRIRRIFTIFEDNPEIGLIYPQNFHKLPYMANTWLESRGVSSMVGTRLGVRKLPDGYFDFPLGTMFWARREAIGAVFSADFSVDEFPEESGQIDGTLAHCIERMLGLVTAERAYRVAVLRDDLKPSWSRWRFEQYFSRSKKHIESLIANPTVEVVVFDIFDTLLTRPLVHPLYVQKLVAHRLPQYIADAYLKYRSIAESTARNALGRDVNLGEIGRELLVLSGISEDDAAHALRAEEDIEADLVSPRSEVVSLYRYALAVGKQVVIASDMFLPRPVLERMLRKCGVEGWEDLFVSGEVGLRKDTGALYCHILSKFQVRPQAVLVVGDNERSDFQIPHGLGMRYCHVLRSVEIGKALPGIGSIVEQASASLDAGDQLTVGIILEHLYNTMFCKSFYPAFLPASTPYSIGYAVLGPVCLAFCQWLGRTAREGGLERLYFLSREGEFLQQVFERLRLFDPSLPESRYLVVSRRALTVPAISNLDDALDICRARYFPNSLHDFFVERFGLQLDEVDLSELHARGFWERGRLLEVGDDGDVAFLEPVIAHLWERIQRQAAEERLLAAEYLDTAGLSSPQEVHVVDIGYSGTIQKALVRITGRAVGGLYMLTSIKAKELGQSPGSLMAACFGEWIPPGSAGTLMYRQSFMLEKLLSADQGQLLRYVRKGEGVGVELRASSSAERRSVSVRREVRAGAEAFVSRALALSDIFAGWFVPPATAATLFEAYCANLSPADKEILASLACDDHYCGRGVAV